MPWYRGVMFVSPNQYFDMPDEQRRSIAQACAMRIAPRVGGQLDWSDGSALLVTGQFNGRQARLRIQLSFGTMFVELNGAGDVRLPLGVFELHCDPHPGRHAGHERHYLTPSVYVEGGPNEREMVSNLMRRLPQQAQTALLQTLSQFDRGFFTTDGESLNLFCPAWVTLGPQAPQYVSYYLNLLFNLSNDMDVAWRGVV